MHELLLKKTTTDPEAIKANTAHNFITHRGFEMIKAMVMVGEILFHKKNLLGHGKWIPWVEDNLEFSYKTATNYIRLFENRDEIFARKPISLQDTLAILSDTKRITPGLLLGDYKLLRRNIVEPIKIVRNRIKRMPKEPIHYEMVVQIMEELQAEIDKLINEIS